MWEKKIGGGNDAFKEKTCELYNSQLKEVTSKVMIKFRGGY
jgi:hypothetical protein